MHVAILATHFASGQPASAEPHLANLVNAIARIDHENRYTLFVRDDNKDCFPSGKNIEHIVVPSLCRFKWIRVLYEQVMVPCISAFHKFDVIHFTANAGPVLLPCRSVGTVHWVVDPILTRSFRWDRRVYTALIHRLSMTNAGRLIAVSKACKNELAKTLKIPDNKIEVIYHGVDRAFKPGWPQEMVKAMRARYGIREKYLLSVTSSAPYKNLSILLDAFARAKLTYGIPHQLVLAGNVNREYLSGLLEKNRQYSKNLDWNKEIISTGYIPHQEMPVLYSGASLLVYVSLRETFGLAVTEAMASGVPTIVSNIPALIEVAGNATLVVDPHNTNEIAESMHRILATPELSGKLVRRGLARAAEFSWDQAARETIEVYKKVVA